MKAALVMLLLVLLIRAYQTGCPNNENRKLDEPAYGCLALHWAEDTSRVSIEWILENYAHPKFNADSTECYVTDLVGFPIQKEE